VRVSASACDAPRVPGASPVANNGNSQVPPGSSVEPGRTSAPRAGPRLTFRGWERSVMVAPARHRFLGPTSVGCEDDCALRAPSSAAPRGLAARTYSLYTHSPYTSRCPTSDWCARCTRRVAARCRRHVHHPADARARRDPDAHRRAATESSFRRARHPPLWPK
jgi:hypothetical protein